MPILEILKRLAVSLMIQAILLTAVYYVSGFYQLASIIALFPIIYLVFRQPLASNGLPIEKPADSKDRLLFFLIATSDLFILLSAFFARSTEPLITPWQVMPASIFAAYALASAGLLFYFKTHGHHGTLLLTLHAAATYGLSAIIFSNGFGYDPHVHRATEEFIWKFGSLEPKTPYYLGQYLIVLTVHAVTGFSIASIDTLLTPLAALTLPTVAVYALQASYGLTKRAALYGALALFLIPSLSFTFTVPHNLTAIIFLIIVLLGPGAKTLRQKLLLIILAVFALTLHPLLGAPCLILALALPYFEFSFVRLMTCLALAAATPLLFALHLKTQGQAAFTFTNPFENLSAFLALFQDPFQQTPAPFFWRVLYGLRQSLPELIFVGASLGCLLSCNDRLKKQAMAVFLGLLASLFFISTLFIFPGILPHEQAEYALRYKYAIALALVPALMIFFSWLAEHKFPLALSIISIFAPVAFYFTYPTFDAKSNISAWNLSRDDYEAVQIVEKSASGKTYLALSNSLTAVAALETLGFERVQSQNFPYQIHDQGDVAEAYRRFLQTPTRQTADGIIWEKKVCRLYVLTSAYEPWFVSLTETATLNSDKKYSTSDGVIHIFEYRNRDSGCL